MISWPYDILYSDVNRLDISDILLVVIVFSATNNMFLLILNFSINEINSGTSVAIWSYFSKRLNLSWRSSSLSGVFPVLFLFSIFSVISCSSNSAYTSNTFGKGKWKWNMSNTLGRCRAKEGAVKQNFEEVAFNCISWNQEWRRERLFYVGKHHCKH